MTGLWQGGGAIEWWITRPDIGVYNYPTSTLFLASAVLDPLQFMYTAVDAIAEIANVGRQVWLNIA